MPISTNLNTAPYYDDFDEDDNFQRILFRPGFAIQARELTQLQSILQNQIEQHGRHTFRDGAMVIPGHQVFDNAYQSIKLEPKCVRNHRNPVLKSFFLLSKNRSVSKN